MRILDFQILFGLIENYKPASGKSDPSRDNSNYVRLLIVSLAVIVGRLELLVSEKLKVHSMIETRHLKNIVIFFQTILSFMLPKKVTTIYNDIARIYGIIFLFAPLKQKSTYFFW